MQSGRMEPSEMDTVIVEETACNASRGKHQPRRTWLVAVAVLLVGLYGVSAVSLIQYVERKASMRSTFLVQSEKTDKAIEVLLSQPLRSAFFTYFLLLLVAIPFLVSKLRPKSVWISIAAVFILLIPMHWYWGKITHVAMQFVDWEQVFPE